MRPFGVSVIVVLLLCNCDSKRHNENAAKAESLIQNQNLLGIEGISVRHPVQFKRRLFAKFESNLSGKVNVNCRTVYFYKKGEKTIKAFTHHYGDAYACYWSSKIVAINDFNGDEVSDFLIQDDDDTSYDLTAYISGKDEIKGIKF